ncbi:hypothetical protein BB560_005722, partial [Smittium megazygosporum]
MLSVGISGCISVISLETSSTKSPCNTISSWPKTFLLTEHPHANCEAKCLLVAFNEIPNTSKPVITVTAFFFDRSSLLTVTFED